MKTAVTLLVSLLAVSSAVWVYRSVHTQPAVSKAVFAQFVAWKSRFGKLYASPSENAYRLSVFAAQVDTVAKLNAQYDAYLQRTGQSALSEAMFAVPADADLTTQEFTVSKTGLSLPEEGRFDVEEYVEKEAPSQQLSQVASFEYRVRNQGSCGSCWAFSTVATLEKLYYDINRVQVDLSQQFLVDCSEENYGCQGGWPMKALEFAQRSDMIQENFYPYLGAPAYCYAKEVPQRTLFSSLFQAKAIRWSMSAIQGLARRKITAGVVVFASGAFRYVSSSDDVFDTRGIGECEYRSNHAVNMVDAGDNYVTVINSWGKTWGKGGFKKIIPCSDESLLGSAAHITHGNADF